MKKLLAYIAEENRCIAQRIKLQFGRAPLDGELMDVKTTNGRAKIREHLECSLESEVLHQDGDRPLREAQADYKRLTTIQTELNNYKAIKSGRNN